VPQATEETLRRLAIHDDAFVESVLACGFGDTSASGLDAKTQALARVGALVAVGASTPEYLSVVGLGLAAGASFDEVVGVLVAVMPSIGADRVVTAAPRLALALGYDVDEGLERLD
jgi:alkylhydroperoxidase/carboxymuconolactone decarboxylase family protein YurZ